jgi:hypothetical protein
MANASHLERLRHGADVWNAWRQEQSSLVPDLSDANLSGASLSGANLRDADLSGADLRNATLTDADLSWANLNGADLSGANLSRADLSEANLSGASLSGASLLWADLRRANLRDADLSRADLSGANLRDADLSGASLSGATLLWADLSGAQKDRSLQPQPNAYPEPSPVLDNGAAPAMAAEPTATSGAPANPPVQAAPRPPLPSEVEPVDAAVFCPPRVARGTVFLVQVFLYPPAAEVAVLAQAQQRDPTATRLGSYSLPIDVPRGTRIDVHLEIPLLRVEEADAAIVWRGVRTAVQFEVYVPNAVASPNAIGRVRFAVAAMPVGTLRFQVTLMTPGTAAAPAEYREAQTARYRRAFTSYASEDRAEVLRRVQAFRISGMSVFQDILDLGPGERWERALYREIDNCDVFLLFWSKAAAVSEWVSREIDYALARQGDNAENPPAIQPVPIEGPPIVPPPPRLAGLHFNDALLAQILATTSRQ